MKPTLSPSEWMSAWLCVCIGLSGAVLAFGFALALTLIEMPWLGFGAGCYALALLVIVGSYARALQRHRWEPESDSQPSTQTPLNSQNLPTLRGNAVHHHQPSTGGGSPEPGVAAYDADKVNSSVDARAALADSGSNAQSIGPVRSFLRRLRERIAFEVRWHRHYKPMLRKPIPASRELSQELRRKLLNLQRPLR